jgi:hypothetical protein
MSSDCQIFVLELVKTTFLELEIIGRYKRLLGATDLYPLWEVEAVPYEETLLRPELESMYVVNKL